MQIQHRRRFLYTDACYELMCRPSAMATVVEVLELSGVPTLCASKATHEEAHSKVGEVIAKALQVCRWNWLYLSYSSCS